MNTVKREARALILPAAVGLLIGSVMVLIYLNLKPESIDKTLFWFFGTFIEEEFDLFSIALFLTPPVLQLTLLGSEIPREIHYAEMVLTRSYSRARWLTIKLSFVWLRSLIMSLCIILPVLLLSFAKGVPAGEHLAESAAALFMTWVLCQGMFVTWSNVLGLWLKPSICVIMSILIYALGLPLFLGRIPGWRLWPSVQGMLYAHSFVFGRSDSEWFVPLLSAAYSAVSTAAAALIGVFRIRSMDLF